MEGQEQGEGKMIWRRIRDFAGTAVNTYWCGLLAYGLEFLVETMTTAPSARAACVTVVAAGLMIAGSAWAICDLKLFLSGELEP